MIEVILFQPEIPQNTGNIARSCVVTGASLTLVTPLGFSLSERQLKRAGLDYLKDLPILQVEDMETHLKEPFFFLSTKGTKKYSEIPYQSLKSDQKIQIVFGSESSGLPLSIHQKWPELFYTIPMKKGARSLNLSNAVAIVLYELLRQTDFRGLE